MHNRGLIPLLILSMLGTTLSGCASGPRWELLFDGKSIDGWVKRGGDATYRVEHGEIVGTTNPTATKQENTFLCTPNEYADFVLEYDFKIDPKLNSGVQIRSQSFPNYDNGRVHGYQVEIDPAERAWTAGIYDEARRGWLYDLKNNEPARKAFKQNKWNHVRVEAKGDSIKTWLNGVPAADLHDSLTHSGFIGLQVHASSENQALEVRFKNIKIKPSTDPWLITGKNAVWLVHSGYDPHLIHYGINGLRHPNRIPYREEWHPLGKPDEQAHWGWHDYEEVNHRFVEVNYLEVNPGSGNIITKKQFGDARYHVEFCTDENGKTGQENGNSGVYVQGRYEVQILNSASEAPTDDNCGAIYKIKKADYGTVRKAGEWQTYDIWFTAPRFDDRGAKSSNARMTVYHNGTRIHDNVEVPHSTGAGQPEIAPPNGGIATGPLMLQDHGNKIRFRNVWVAPLNNGK